MGTEKLILCVARPISDEPDAEAYTQWFSEAEFTDWRFSGHDGPQRARAALERVAQGHAWRELDDGRELLFLPEPERIIGGRGVCIQVTRPFRREKFDLRALADAINDSMIARKLARRLLDGETVDWCPSEPMHHLTLTCIDDRLLADQLAGAGRRRTGT